MPVENSIQAELPKIIPKVLVVDDELETAEEVAELLTFDGFTQCEIACDPLQAIDIVRNDQDISIIITDLKMPGMNGLQMIRRIQKCLNDDRELAVIVITGHAGTQEAIKALRLGAMDFITKPISPDRLLHAVGRAAETLQLRKLDKQFHEHLEFTVEEHTQEVRLLSDDLLRSNQKLQSLNLELSASNRVKSEFLTLISHELRTGNKLLRIITNILDLVTVDSGELKPRSVELDTADIAERVIEALGPKQCQPPSL